ncbi:response regulator transcription factor [Priestia flexa]|uniref:response regulator transcription factor n=1 Tax=Priestia flexa TaxID=86664 RepID=UPI000956DC14|nr:LuxR C-terminal-related transcriptional regulator [Priestia flexa]SIQ61510.1 two-component system, NarL family, response regulator LiaR [Priestia flexa]
MKITLSNREKEISILVAKGYKDHEISESLFISRRRVGEIILNIKNKYKLKSRVSIGILAYHFGWLSINEVLKEGDMQNVQQKKNTIY